MENRDPHELIEATAAALRRRRLVNNVLPGLPAAVVLAAFAAAGRLPVELAAAGTIAALALLLHVSAPGPGIRQAASRLDQKTAGRDHFLTLATMEIAPPLGDLIEAGAIRLGERLRAVDLAPPLAWRALVRGAVAGAALALLLFFAPTTFPPAPGPADRLARIADQLAQGGGAAGADLARELRAAAAMLRDPGASSEERQQAVQKALEKLEPPKEEKGSGTQGGGGEERGELGAGGEELRAEARSALERASESTGGQTSGTGESSGSQQSENPGEERPGESEGTGQGESSGGGIEGPRPDPAGAKEREGDGAGTENRPDDSPAKSAESKGGAGEGREARDPNRPGPGEAKGPDPSAGTTSGGTAGSPSTSEGPENPDLPGDGTGWKIVDGRYVRVRVPEGENEALETERVRGPGEVEPTTPYSNAPLPGEGPAGEPVERQPLPLEYRNVLKEGNP